MAKGKSTSRAVVVEAAAVTNVETGKTALDHAVERGHDAVAETLRRHAAWCTGKQELAESRLQEDSGEAVTG